MASTLPRFANDQQAPFVLEQAQAWRAKRPGDRIIILAPHDPQAARLQTIGNVEIRRFQYFVPSRLQALAYPAILPNLKRRPWLATQILPFVCAEYFAAKRIVRDEHIDLVYAHWVMPQGFVARWLNRTTGVPYIVQNHSSDLSVFHRAGSVGRAVARKIVRDARRMFCVNQRQKGEAIRLFPASVQNDIAKKITVLPMGVGMDTTAVLRYSDTVSPKYTLGTISRLSQKKGIDLLIAALERLAENGQTVSTGIAGDGEDREVLTAMPRKAVITFPGFLSGPDKIRFFNDARFMAFPSVSTGTDVEGLPVALLEALCCGKISITSHDTNVTMLDEWDQIANDVFLLKDPRNIGEFAAMISRLLDLDGASIAARSDHLRKVMERYRWPHLIDEYLAAIEPEGCWPEPTFDSAL